MDLVSITLLYFCLFFYIPICKGEEKKKIELTAERFTNQIENKGYDVLEGTYFFSGGSHCDYLIDTGEGCHGNNPSTPYGGYSIPLIEGEHRKEGKNTTRIRGDEAIVFIGITPPESVYYGYTHYIYDKVSDNPEESVVVYASLSDTLNPQNIKLDRPVNGSYEHSFGKDVVIVATPHRDVFEDVEKVLLNLGVSSDIINLQVISPELFKWGLGEDSDTLTFLTRISFLINGTDGDEFLNDPPGIVLRVTPKEEMNVTHPFEKPVRTERAMETDESYLEETFEALEHSLFEHFDPFIVKSDDMIVQEKAILGEDCILNGKDCMADNSDATYSYARGQFAMDGDKFYVVIGVDHMHSNTGAKYSSVSVLCPSTGNGIADFNSVYDMAGSTKAYLGEEYEHRDSLYVVTVRRNCTGYDYCVEIGDDEKGLPEDEAPMFNFRVYLHENGTVGPPIESILLSKIFFVDPTSDLGTSVFKENTLVHGMVRGTSSMA